MLIPERMINVHRSISSSYPYRSRGLCLNSSHVDREMRLLFETSSFISPFDNSKGKVGGEEKKNFLIFRCKPLNQKKINKNGTIKQNSHDLVQPSFPRSIYTTLVLKTSLLNQSSRQERILNLALVFLFAGKVFSARNNPHPLFFFYLRLGYLYYNPLKSKNREVINLLTKTNGTVESLTFRKYCPRKERFVKIAQVDCR